MARKALMIGGGLIAVYLVVRYYTGAAKVAAAGGSAGSNVIKAFQGR